MINYRYFFIFLVVSILCNSCYKEEVVFDASPDDLLEIPLILRMDQKTCAFDYATSMLRYPISNHDTSNFEAFIEFQDHSVIYFGDQLLINNQINNLGSIDLDSEYNLKIITNGVTTELGLTFTDLTVVQIILPDKIYDEPKSLAKVIINYSDSESLASYIGIEQRGGWYTLGLPKRSYNFTFLNSIYTDDKIARNLFNLEGNSDWILDGMFTDEMRCKNKVSSKIWRGISDKNHFGSELNYVELFINNEHQGLYCLGPNINDQLIGLEGSDALLYKSIGWTGPDCFSHTSYDISTIDRWDGWVQKYPNKEQRINWLPLSELRNLIVDGSNEDFSADISKVIDLDNFIDYYLFLNLICGVDNLGKNIYLTRYSDSDPLYVIPWDFDACFFYTHKIISDNRLYHRLVTLSPLDFKDRLKDRWFYLRENSFSSSNLASICQESFDELSASKVAEIENRKWGSNFNIDVERSRLANWITNRVYFLDSYYEDL